MWLRSSSACASARSRGRLPVPDTPPRWADRRREGARGAQVAAAVDHQRKLWQRPPRRAEHDRAAGLWIERGVVARAHEAGRLVDRREERRAVEGHGAAGVGADLGVRDDPLDRPAAAVRGQVQLVGLEPDEHDRRADLLGVGVLGERREELGGADRRRGDRTPVLVDQAPPAPPRRAGEPAQVEEGPKRGGRHQHRQADGGRGGSGRHREQAPAAEVAPALGDDLRELRRRLGLGLGVLALELLGHHQVPARDDERGGQEPEGAAKGEPEVLGLVGDAVDGVDDDEADRAQGRQPEERGDGDLGARSRRAGRDDPRRRRPTPGVVGCGRRATNQTTATSSQRHSRLTRAAFPP